MFSDLFTGDIKNIAGFLFNLAREEFLHIDLSDEAESLRILTFCIGKSGLSCDISDF